MKVRHQTGRTAIGRQAGLTLVELMVAMAIGVFLIAGALTVFAKTRDLYRTNEDAARLQETARFAMGLMEGDLRMANYWGLMNRAELFLNAGVDNAGVDDNPPDPSLDAFEAAIDECGDNWAVRVRDFIEAFEGYPFGAGACAAQGNAAAAGDVLVVRRASSNVIPLATPGPIKVQASRTSAALFFGNDTSAIPAGFLPPLSQTHALVAHGYYVSSDAATGMPSLRRKRLGVDTGAPAILDEEVVPGIEDLQVELGIDENGDEIVDYYDAPPPGGVGAGDEVVAVTIWLMVRSERPEVGFTDNRRYVYAGRDITPNDGFRRLLTSKTIQLRNTRR